MGIDLSEAYCKQAREKVEEEAALLLEIESQAERARLPLMEER